MHRTLILLTWLGLSAATFAQGTTYRLGQVLTVGATVPATCESGGVFILTGLTPNLYICTAANEWTALARTGASAALPVGMIVLASSGSCPAGTSEATDLAGKMLLTTTIAAGNVGTTGGADSVTPAGSNTAATFTGTASQVTSAQSAGTPAGSNSAPALAMNSYTPAGTNGAITMSGSTANESAHTHSVTAAGTNGTVAITPLLNAIVWPAGVPTFTGSALATHAHELPWQIPSTTTIRQIAVATFGTGTSRAATAVSAAGTANTTSAAVALTEAKSAGTPAGTVAWPAGVPTVTGASTTVGAQTFTGSAVTSAAGSVHLHAIGTVAASTPTFTGNAATLTGTVGAPTFTGSALSTHTHTLTPAGTNTAATFTGSSFDNRSAFVRVIACRVN